MRPAILACSILAVGCNAVFGLEERALVEDATSEDTTALDDASADGSDTSIDEPLVDTGETDSSVDTLSADTHVDTTAPPDTPDASPDTSMEVSGPPVLTGSLEIISPSGTVNLTAEGTADWGHWGHTTASSFNYRGDAGGIGMVAIGMPASVNFKMGFSWSGGKPTGAVTNTDRGILVSGGDSGFTVDVAASTSTLRTFRIYTAWNRTTGPITATLSGAAAITLASSAPGPETETQFVALNYTFRGASPDAKLTVKFVKTGGALGFVSLLAATLR